MTTYTAYFRTDAETAERNFEADTPAQALKKARRFLRERAHVLFFERYDSSVPVNEIAITASDGGETLTEWLDDELRLRLAARDLLDAGEQVIARWERGDLAEAVRALAAAVAKAKGGAA